ncbi:RNA recognition motif domain [Arabidopsis thaliana x Arabidopsis arenosa]|uniref:RNA recognition motif domain n=1 Tax=Arabidopsis thaliana x Arabidopsis arenosa TaxID=1240361 RepID=A0A8T1XD85_9BRAS|nr:RNA recognition motif domain [Arabidopsis thaliana x Arabidopsis arenosa]
MGKKKSKETETESLNDESQTQTGIFSTLFSGEVAEGESSGFASLFSDDNPFRRKKPQEIKESSSLDDKRNAENEEGDETVLPVKTKKSKKEKKLKSPVTDSGDDGVEKETNSEAIEETGLVSKRKKRKRDEIENEYETKKYGSVEKKKVGEKRKKADEVADTMVSKEGFDDESKLLRTVFVGNLPLKVKKKVILKEFSKFGEVESVRIRSVPIVDSKRTRKGAIMLKQINEKASSVHAYVVFETEKSAEASLAHNMSLIDGNHVRVDRACPPRKKQKGQDDTHLYDPKRTVFMGNLPFDVKDEEVYQLFTGKSNLENSIEAVRVIRDPHLNIGKGIAYVLFKTREAANLVIKKGYLKLRERELRISRVKPDATPSKRKSNPSEAYSPAQKRLQKDKVVTPTPTGKANLSYQGVRASKSGDDKKNPYQKSPAQAKMRPRGSSSNEDNKKSGNNSALKQRSQKRPAVAARKAKANSKGSKESGGKRFAGTKRKQENRTPESFSKKKKTKRF